MNRDPLRPIDQSQIARYEEDGVVCLQGLFDRGWIDYVAEAVEEAMRRPGPHG